MIKNLTHFINGNPSSNPQIMTSGVNWKTIIQVKQFGQGHSPTAVQTLILRVSGVT